jgi:hypothetical protein
MVLLGCWSGHRLVHWEERNLDMEKEPMCERELERPCRKTCRRNAACAESGLLLLLLRAYMYKPSNESTVGRVGFVIGIRTSGANVGFDASLAPPVVAGCGADH